MYEAGSRPGPRASAVKADTGRDRSVARSVVPAPCVYGEGQRGRLEAADVMVVIEIFCKVEQIVHACEVIFLIAHDGAGAQRCLKGRPGAGPTDSD